MNKKIGAIFFLQLIISTTLIAQCSSWIDGSTVSFTSGAYSVTTDGDNNVYSTGSFFGSIHFDSDSLVDEYPLSDYYVNKFNSSGAIQWAIQFRTSGFENPPPVICQKNGSLYVAGTYYDTLITDVQTNAMLTSPGENFFLLKLDLNGKLLWTKQFYGGIYQADRVAGITVNNFNQVYFTGDFDDTAIFNSGALVVAQTNYFESFVTKTDSNGNVIWAIQSVSATIGSNASGITTDENYNILLKGNCADIITYNSKTFNADANSTRIGNPYVAKFDSLGDCLWITGGQGTSVYFSSSNTAVDTRGNIYFAGSMYNEITFSGQTLNPSNGAFYYCKYTSDGNLVWIKQLDVIPTTKNQSPISLVTDTSNHLWMSGWVDTSAKFGNFNISDSGLFIAEFDSNGTILNAIGSKGLNGIYSSNLDVDGDLYLACSSVSDTVLFDGGILTRNVGQFEGIAVILKYCTSSTGINPLPVKSNQVTVYPNPSNGAITIAATKNIDEVMVTNLLGQLVYQKFSLGTKQFNFELKGEGMYFVAVTSGNETSTGKIMVSK